MNKRCIVNIATGEFYCKMQDRLRNSFRHCIDTWHGQDQSFIKYNTDKGIDLLTWTDCLPKGSRSHEESPYGFKIHAIKAAYEMGYTSILWLDSPAYAVKEDISPIFDKIEKEGYYAMSHIDPLEKYVGDYALAHFQLPSKREKLNGKNLPSGSCYGFDMTRQGFYLYGEMAGAEKNGLFRSEVNGDIVHRHDEAILALALLKHGFDIFTFDPLFQSDSPECVIKSGG